MTTNENPDTYLGIQFEKAEVGLFLYQENYARKILARYNMENCKILKTPMNSGRQDIEDKIYSNFEYRNAVGSLLSSKTSPDIAYSVNYTSPDRSIPQKNASNAIGGTTFRKLRSSPLEESRLLVSRLPLTPTSACTASPKTLRSNTFNNPRHPPPEITSPLPISHPPTDAWRSGSPPGCGGKVTRGVGWELMGRSERGNEKMRRLASIMAERWRRGGGERKCKRDERYGNSTMNLPTIINPSGTALS
ncbi:hypothetical protein J437_LFUL002518 [Ladona fulva]|uniref:Mitochondrial protein n=1 Tax=Ladona fulva TaxID=123851 RepID=A0A8K0KSF2_LADFU|nr:hypothetical protein J437_LFUL002518 [Ladona fulva]